MWTVLFDEFATKVLGFNANTYTGLTSDAVRYAALSTLRGPTVILIISSSTSSDNVEATVSGIHRIWNRTETMLNKQTFDVALDVACVRYVFDELVRMLNLLEDEYCMPSSDLIQHLMRWAVMLLTDRCGKLQWRLHMMGEGERDDRQSKRRQG